MNPLSEIGLVVGRELRKNLRSAKGIILLALSLLGGVVVTLGMLKLDEIKRTKLHDLSAEGIRALREETLSQVYNDPATGKFLADAPEVLIGLLGITVWLGPLLVALLGFDAVSADIQHRTVRYWTVRTRRWSYFVGKFLGLWAVVSLITLGMHMVIWIVCIARHNASAGDTLAWGLRFWLVTLPIGAAWCGLATLVGSLFRSPILALLVIFSSFFVLWVSWMIGLVSGATPFMYAYPNFYDAWLLSPRFDKAAGGFAICSAFAAATMGLGGALFARRDV